MKRLIMLWCSFVLLLYVGITIWAVKLAIHDQDILGKFVFAFPLLPFAFSLLWVARIVLFLKEWRRK